MEMEHFTMEMEVVYNGKGTTLNIAMVTLLGHRSFHSVDVGKHNSS